MSYQTVSPENYTEEHKEFIGSFKDTVNLISRQTDLVFGCKDIHSKHIISTDKYANLVALPRGGDVTGRFDREMPCEGTAQFAEDFVDEDQEVLSYKDVNRKKSVLAVHEYATGLDALVFNLYPLKHDPSQSVLGVIYAAHKIELSNFLTMIPNYFLEFGSGGSIEKTDGALKIGDAEFTEYEHEVGFLLTMNWSFKKIASYMNQHRPLSQARTADTIYKCRDRMCLKLNCSSAILRDTLIGVVGMHRKMPHSFYNRLIGSRPLS
jgi:hypothetical protein